MTKFDLVLARLRQLPPAELEQIAQDIELMLDNGQSDYRLTPEQEAELQRRLADPNRQYVSHEEVARHFEKKYGR